MKTVRVIFGMLLILFVALILFVTMSGIEGNLEVYITIVLDILFFLVIFFVLGFFSVINNVDDRWIPEKHRKLLRDDLKAFKANIKKEALREGIEVKELLDDIAKHDVFQIYISEAFRFERSDEGVDFWSNISYRN